MAAVVEIMYTMYPARVMMPPDVKMEEQDRVTASMQGGHSILEPNVPPQYEEFNAIMALVKGGFPKEKVVIRVAVSYTHLDVYKRQAQMCGRKQAGGTGLCLVPRPAAPFFAVPAQYFSGEDVRCV